MSSQIAADISPSIRKRRSLEYLPVGLFGSVMGLTGLSVAWRLAAARYGVSTFISEAIAIVAVALFLSLALGYLIKAITAPEAVVADFATPSPAIYSAPC